MDRELNVERKPSPSSGSPRVSRPGVSLAPRTAARRFSPGRRLGAVSCPLKVREAVGAYVANARLRASDSAAPRRARPRRSYIMRNARERKRKNAEKEEEAEQRERTSVTWPPPPPPRPPADIITLSSRATARLRFHRAKPCSTRIRVAVSLKRDLRPRLRASCRRYRSI